MTTLITNPTNIRYLTGFVGVENRDAYVLLTPEILYLFTNSLYIESVKNLQSPISNTQIKIVEISHENPISKAITNVIPDLTRFAESRRVGNPVHNTLDPRVRGDDKIRLEFETDNLTVSEYEKLKATGIELIPTQNKIESMRIIKRKDEIEQIKLAADITDQCFTMLLKQIRPGMTERKLSLYIEEFFKSKGSALAFDSIVAFNEHSSMPHYQSLDNNPLRRGSLILLDFGARVNGYCADMTRVVFLGTPKPEWIKTYETVLAANNKAIELLKNGERHGATLDAAAKEIVAEANFPVYPHSLGHAVGLDIHESPRLTTHKDEILKENMVVTVEPGVYLEGKYGIRIEDLVLLKENSIEILSKSHKEIIII